MKRQFFISIFIILSTLMFSQERFRSGIFLHHSTGDYIWGPNESSTSVPDEIITYNSDHGFTGDQICSMDEKWWPNSTDNDWYYWYKIFTNDTTADITPIIEDNKIVVIKSCYPSSYVVRWGQESDTSNLKTQTVYNYKWLWRKIIKVMEDNPNTFFVIWTNAQRAAGNTTYAYNSHLFCTWAKDTLAKGEDLVYGEFPKNVYVFDYFHKIVGDDYKMKPEYAKSDNVHPNALATELVAPQFVKEIFDAAIAYENFYNNVLPSPVLTSPSDNSEDISLNETLNWESVPDAVTYRLQVSTASDFSSSLLENETKDTFYTFSDELSQQTEYFWRVKSIGSSTESNWTDSWSFTTTTATSMKNSTKDIFRLYPNPTSGKLNVSINNCFCDYLKINVYSIIGHLVKTLDFNDFSNLPLRVYLNDLPKGQYIINLISDNIKISKRIVVKK